MLCSRQIDATFVPAISLAENTDDRFRAVRFAFHKAPSSGLRKAHTKTGSNQGGHATKAPRTLPLLLVKGWDQQA